MTFQERVQEWIIYCFDKKIAEDKIERNHRFLEESLELVQACGCTQEEAHCLVDYVYGRSTGEADQEIGGVMVTLAALCSAHKHDMYLAAEDELARIWNPALIDQIRQKQAGKPKNSPLPLG
jgi:NTP pyrophosphatase (non-canonical NTP hydrolase)